MAKNKNQNRQREQREQRGDRQNPSMEPREHTGDAMDDEHGIPTGTQAPRRQQKRFGHN